MSLATLVTFCRRKRRLVNNITGSMCEHEMICRCSASLVSESVVRKASLIESWKGAEEGLRREWDVPETWRQHPPAGSSRQSKRLPPEQPKDQHPSQPQVPLLYGTVRRQQPRICQRSTRRKWKQCVASFPFWRGGQTWSVAVFFLRVFRPSVSVSIWLSSFSPLPW